MSVGFINIHACAALIEARGVLIRGPSASGKSVLTRMLVEENGAAGKFARWVADDRVKLVASNGKIIATCPATIFGMAEQPHHGIYSIDATPSAVIDLIVDLIACEKLDRMPETSHTNILGLELPLLFAPRKEAVISASLIVNRLSIMGE